MIGRTYAATNSEASASLTVLRATDPVGYAVELIPTFHPGRKDKHFQELLVAQKEKRCCIVGETLTAGCWGVKACISRSRVCPHLLHGLHYVSDEIERTANYC
eukprot:532855-Hanusia_phi.AAC.1